MVTQNRANRIAYGGASVVADTIDSLIDGLANQVNIVSSRRALDDRSTYQMEKLMDEVARLSAMADSLLFLLGSEMANRIRSGGI